MRISPRVQEALASKSRPVVALESTIISHGMPWPANLECARDVEQIVEQAGAVPATVAIVGGKVHVGLDGDMLESFARLPSSRVRKCSRRDIAVAVGLMENGATTVSGTMFVANQCGIELFVTGGVGGVHRGAFGMPGGSCSLDVSADLTELGRTRMTVVCAGVKSILDIGHTLEYLETQGVTVMTLVKGMDTTAGASSMFPSFFTQRSKEVSPLTLGSVEDVAKVVLANRECQVDSGMLVAVPNPDPAEESVIEDAIERALASLERNSNVSGKEVTPYLLKYVNEATGGCSLQANMALIRNNAKVGAEIAVKVHQMDRNDA